MERRYLSGMSQVSEQTLYEILEISSDASLEDIHKAFSRVKNTYSPNSPALYSVFSREEAEQLLKIIDEAYAVLSNSTKRREYDLSLKQRGMLEGAQVRQNQVQLQNTADAVPFNTEHTIPEAGAVEFKPERPSPFLTIVNKEKASPQTLSPTGKTRFSHYEINPDFEIEIENQKIFDGSFLQKVRQYKRITLDQVSESSRIGRQYLTAVESNDFSSLPAPVFVRGFIIQMARILGINEKLAADSYMKIFKESREK